MILWLHLFYVQFYCIFKILNFISLEVLFSIIVSRVSIILCKNFGTISSQQYWDGVLLEYELAERGGYARAWMRGNGTIEELYCTLFIVASTS